MRKVEFTEEEEDRLSTFEAFESINKERMEDEEFRKTKLRRKKK
jgi:hypothetical protein